MTIEIPDIRPRIISNDFAEELDEYRRFRHMFRHSYGAELCWRKFDRNLNPRIGESTEVSAEATRCL